MARRCATEAEYACHPSQRIADAPQKTVKLGYPKTVTLAEKKTDEAQFSIACTVKIN
jgi:hypothetical protein